MTVTCDWPEDGPDPFEDGDQEFFLDQEPFYEPDGPEEEYLCTCQEGCASLRGKDCNCGCVACSEDEQ